MTASTPARLCAVQVAILRNYNMIAHGTRARQAAFGLWVLATVSLAPAADIISIWGGARGTIILKSDGTVWTWGSNIGGKLGIGSATTNRVLVPVEVHGAGDVDYLH